MVAMSTGISPIMTLLLKVVLLNLRMSFIPQMDDHRK
jgi:hypothetical protein